MPGDYVETAVSEAVLLRHVASERRSPVMEAASTRTNDKPVSSRGQAVTQVVVVTVPERLVEEAGGDERASTIRGVAGAHMVRHGRDPVIALRQIQSHHTREDG